MAMNVRMWWKMVCRGSRVCGLFIETDEGESLGKFPWLVLLFFYLSYKLGVCECIGRTLCKMVWACFATCFSIWEYGCYFFCYKLPLMKRKRRRRQKDIEESDIWSTSGGGGSSSYRVPLKHIEQRRPLPRQWTDYKGDRLRRSLRPRSHRTRVAITGDLRHRHHHHHRHRHGHASMVNDITVTRTSMFAQKGSNSKGVKMHRRQRR
ncbi:hypothetical protein RJ639_023649 [Escallonia herrerae]|uniref:Uncharacterized protein n=1 Tax=Escallonia herrerae TaxID=1293975 RepID=A0AA88V1P4_9ASTE|nr:hypothetical protein RJ639_023649 [Escallonia herrerae]